MNSSTNNVNLSGRASGESHKRDEPIRFAGSELGAKRHICAFFHNRNEEYQVLLPFIKEGLNHGEKAFHIVDPKLRDEHLQRLRSVGIDVATAEQSGHLELRNWAETYLREGHFKGSANGLNGTHHRRNGHRQGVDRPRYSQGIKTLQSRIRERELRRHSTLTDSFRAIRS